MTNTQSDKLMATLIEILAELRALRTDLAAAQKRGGK